MLFIMSIGLWTRILWDFRFYFFLGRAPAGAPGARPLIRAPGAPPAGAPGARPLIRAPGAPGARPLIRAPGAPGALLLLLLTLFLLHRVQKSFEYVIDLGLLDSFNDFHALH